MCGVLLFENGVFLVYEMVAAQLYDMCGVLLFEKCVFLLYEMVAAQLYDMCGVLLLDKGVFCSMRWYLLSCMICVVYCCLIRVFFVV